MAPRTPPSSPKSRSGSSSPRSPKHFWTKKQRQALLAFHKDGKSTSEMTADFNRLFQQELCAKGFPNGLTKTAISAQFSKAYRTKCQAWQEVERGPDDELAWVAQELHSLSITSVPLTPPNVASPIVATSASPPKTSNTAGTTRASISTGTPRRTRCSSLEAVVIEVSPKQAGASVGQARNVFDTFPEDVAISANRTRTMFGEQVPIIRPTDGDLTIADSITAAEAHSPVPELLFRFYDDRSQGVRLPDGFISGYYAHSTIAPPRPQPCNSHHLFATILQHLNKVRFSSELISTTSNLFFAMRLAAKSTANPRICVIRSSAMPPRKIYHAWPYHLRYKGGRMYYNGTYMNPASHEYLVWATLPHTAIICDFAFADLERCLLGNPQMAKILRVDEMRTKKSNTHLLKNFQTEKLDLSVGIVEGLARLMPQLGITASDPPAVIARLVSEVIRSFKIDLKKTSAKRWEMLAGAFAWVLTDESSQRDVSELQLATICEAFLAGVRVGVGELNWHLNADKQARKRRREIELGLTPREPCVQYQNEDQASLQGVQKMRQTVSRFTYQAQVETQCVDKRVRTTEEDGETITEEDPVDEEEEEAENKPEDEITFVRSRRLSHPREARRRSQTMDYQFVVIDRSDDEDYETD